MQEYRNKLFISTIIVGSIFFILLLRLVYLQILRGDDFETFSRENRIKLINEIAPRGKILDKNGTAIVVDRPSFDVKVFPQEVVNVDAISILLASYLDRNQNEIKYQIVKAKEQDSYFPFIIAKDIDRDTLALIESRKPDLQGIAIEINYLRDYPKGKLGSSLVGYLGKPSKDDLTKYPVNTDSTVGKIGIERSRENLLRGTKGIKYQISDALGREVKSELFKSNIKNKKTVPGNDVFLTIDYNLQKTAEEILSGKVGSIVAVNVNTGEVLVLATSPSYDPEKFVNGINVEEWDELINNIFNPMVNRATQGAYPPGSLFKIVTALAGLKEEVINAESKFFCPGYLKFGKKEFRCWNPEGHNWIDLYEAVARSCDVYFYNVAERLGIEKLSKYAKIFGFGKKTGIEINESNGLVPTKPWKYKVYKEPWYKGETIITSIGQGYLKVTPLQITMMIASVANGGILFKPKIIQKIVSSDGKDTQIFSSEVVGKLPFDNWQIKAIQNSLVGAVNEKYGTGRRAKVKEGTVAGKTGTAQVVSLKSQTHRLFHNDHAWFTSYYPAESPEVAVTVLVEHGGKGGSVAAPLAKKLIEEYMEQQKTVSRK